MVTIGSIVVTTLASIGEVNEIPVMKRHWLKAIENIPAPKSFFLSEFDTGSLGRNIDNIQKAIVAPKMRKEGRTMGLISLLAKKLRVSLLIGAISPQSILETSIAK